MKVLFLTEHGEDIGYGHINRCTALADGFSESNCEITFISRGSPGEYIFNRDYQFKNEKWNRRPFLENALPDYDITVIDSYQASGKILEFIGKNANAPVYLIDATLKFYPQGTILFPSVYADTFDFDNYPRIEVYKGIEYLLFTREFWNVKKTKPAKKLKRIGISLGGIAGDVVVSLLSTLRDTLSDGAEISVFGEMDSEIKRKISLAQCNLRGFLKKEQYVKEISEMDVMICNGGQTLNECLLLGIPTISLICADNQRKNATAWENLGLTAAMDVRYEFKESEFRETWQSVTSYTNRKEINRKCGNHIDHQGAIRAAKKIIDTTG